MSSTTIIEKPRLQYSFVRYIHTNGEVINIGIVFFYNQKEIELKYPKNINKINIFFQNYPTDLILTKLKVINETIKNNNFKDSVLFLTELGRKEGFCVSDIYEYKDTLLTSLEEKKTAIDNLYESYFAHYKNYYPSENQTNLTDKIYYAVKTLGKSNSQNIFNYLKEQNSDLDLKTESLYRILRRLVVKGEIKAEGQRRGLLYS